MKWLAAVVFVLCSNMAHAEREGLQVPDYPKWKEECGSCHLAYPPGLLTADNWKRVVDGLDKHFGSNAAMDARDSIDILEFLQRNSGNNKRHSAASLRISDTQWFKREHREVPSRAWSHPSVKWRANCTACHVKAEQGDWSERGIKLPGGLRIEDND